MGLVRPETLVIAVMAAPSERTDKNDDLGTSARSVQQQLMKNPCIEGIAFRMVA